MGDDCDSELLPNKKFTVLYIAAASIVVPTAFNNKTLGFSGIVLLNECNACNTCDDSTANGFVIGCGCGCGCGCLSGIVFNIKLCAWVVVIMCAARVFFVYAPLLGLRLPIVNRGALCAGSFVLLDEGQ